MSAGICHYSMDVVQNAVEQLTLAIPAEELRQWRRQFDKIVDHLRFKAVAPTPESEEYVRALAAVYALNIPPPWLDKRKAENEARQLELLTKALRDAEAALRRAKAFPTVTWLLNNCDLISAWEPERGLEDYLGDLAAVLEEFISPILRQTFLNEGFTTENFAVVALCRLVRHLTGKRLYRQIAEVLNAAREAAAANAAHRLPRRGREGLTYRSVQARDADYERRFPTIDAFVAGLFGLTESKLPPRSKPFPPFPAAPNARRKRGKKDDLAA